MAQLVTIQIKGMRELGVFLQQAPEKIRTKMLRSAFRAGALVVQEEAKRKAPVETTELQVGIKVGTRLKGTMVVAKIKTSGKHGYLANWLEYGTAAHEIVAKKGENRKALLIAGGVAVFRVDHPGISPTPFMRPALETKANAAILAVANTLKAKMTKAGIEGADEVDVLIEGDEE